MYLLLIRGLGGPRITSDIGLGACSYPSIRYILKQAIVQNTGKEIVLYSDNYALVHKNTTTERREVC